MVLARVLVLSPGFPVADRPYYTPGIVDTLAKIGREHPLTICALNAPPESGAHEYRGLKIVARSFARGLFAGLRFPFDVVWALWPNRTGTFAMLARAPLVVSLLGAELSADKALTYGSSSRLRRYLLPMVLRRARAITAGSIFMQRRARAKFPSLEIDIAPMGVDATRFANTYRRSPWSAGQPLRLLALSDLSPVKRVPLSIAALHLLNAQGLDARLDLFGAQQPTRTSFPVLPHFPPSSELQAPKLNYRGFVAPPQVAEALAEHDVLVHASAHESQGFALIEAALAHRPIATTRVGVAEELSALGAAIEIVDHPSPEALAAAILKAAARPPVSPDVAAKVAARFDVTPCAARFAAILEKAAAR